jgi:hypothetical protein
LKLRTVFYTINLFLLLTVVSSCTTKSVSRSSVEGELLLKPVKNIYGSDLVHLVQQKKVISRGIEVYFNCNDGNTYLTNNSNKPATLAWNGKKYTVLTDKNAINSGLIINTKKIEGKPVLLID